MIPLTRAQRRIVEKTLRQAQQVVDELRRLREVDAAELAILRALIRRPSGMPIRTLSAACGPVAHRTRNAVRRLNRRGLIRHIGRPPKPVHEAFWAAGPIDQMTSEAARLESLLRLWSAVCGAAAQ